MVGMNISSNTLKREFLSEMSETRVGGWQVVRCKIHTHIQREMCTAENLLTQQFFNIRRSIISVISHESVHTIVFPGRLSM